MLPKRKSDTELTGASNFDIHVWKDTGNSEVQQEFRQRIDKLRDEYESISEEIYWNKKIYNSEIRFEPVIGNIYHLYERLNGTCFLSIISPDEWYMKCLGSFRLKFNRKWEKI